jgi:6-phosphogluconolactonase (cycloisomerase 2 family)
MQKRFIANITITLAAAAAAIAQDLQTGPRGAVYTMTNAADANSIVMYLRAPNGALSSSPRMFSTGGKGTGSGLGSQSAIAVTQDGQWLLAVNAGSNTLSLFSVDQRSLALSDIAASNGTMPISVTIHGDTVFVLNAGGSPNISGFRLTHRGGFSPIPGSTKTLNGTGPAEVSFDDHGEALVVTDKTSNQIEVFAFDGGQVSDPVVTPSSSTTPFGFTFAHRDILIVSEADNSALSSYELNGNSLVRVTASLADTQGAACWVVVTNNGKFAYTANAHSSTVSSYSVASNGSLTLLNAVAGNTTPGGGPTDLALDANSSHLYALAGTTISAFSIGPDGALMPIGVVSGLPPTAVGLAAR